MEADEELALGLKIERNKPKHIPGACVVTP